jgi:glutathione S-transferase
VLAQAVWGCQRAPSRSIALEHKSIPPELKLLSFDKGDLSTPAFRALNPRGRVPALEDDGFALYESAAIVEYLEDKYRGGIPSRTPALQPRSRSRHHRDLDRRCGAADLVIPGPFFWDLKRFAFQVEGVMAHDWMIRGPKLSGCSPLPLSLTCFS